MWKDLFTQFVKQIAPQIIELFLKNLAASGNMAAAPGGSALKVSDPHVQAAIQKTLDECTK